MMADLAAENSNEKDQPSAIAADGPTLSLSGKTDLLDRRLAIIKDARFPFIEKMFLTIRAMIEHEDSLINYRSTWFISLNSFLFGSLSLLGTSTVWTTQENQSNPELSVQAYALGVLFSIVGLISCASTYISVKAGYNAIRALEKQWTYSYEPTINGFSTGQKHHLDEKKRIRSPTGELLAYDPEAVLPYIIGGGPFKRSVGRGKFSSYGVIGAVAFLWFVVVIYSSWTVWTYYYA